MAGLECIGVARSDHPGLHRVMSYSDTPAGDCLIHCAESNDRSVVSTGGEELEAEARRTLSALLSKGYRHVVYASSAVLYGDLWMEPRKVTDPLTVIDAYTRIKRLSEEMVLEHGGAVARLANLYGSGMASTNVLSHVLAQLGNDRTIMMRTLDPVRDFLSVHDAAEALVAMIKKRIAGVFNVGSGRGTSIGEIVELVQRVAGTRQLVAGHSSLNRPSCLVLDIAATKQCLGWEPRTLLEEGIRELVKTKMQSGIK